MTFETEIYSFFDNLKRQIFGSPLLLGGINASGGGRGGPPAGFIGLLPQGRIAYDFTEGQSLFLPPSGIFPPSGMSLLHNLNRIRHRIGTLESGGGASISIQEDDVDVGNATVLNFEGGGVSALDEGAGKVTVTITVSGGGGGSVAVKEDNSEIIAAATSLDFTHGLDVTDETGGEARIDVDESELDHDLLSGFVTDEHIGHSTIDLTAGVGLLGGGTIDNDRTFTLDLDELGIETVIAAGDFIAIVDITDSGSQKITFANFESALDHDALVNFTTAEHFTMLDEDAMGSNSDTQAATQQSIKAYVDTQILTTDTLAEVLAIGNITGATDIDISDGQQISFLVTGDNDTVLFDIDVTGTPIFSWDEGNDNFKLTHGLMVVHTSINADDHALEIDVDAAGFGDVKAISIDYITGAIALGQDEGIILLNIDELDATGGEVFGIEILSTEGSANIFGLKAGALVGPIHQDSGVFVNPTTGTDNTPSTDVPAMIDGSTGTTTAIMEADDEYIIIGASVAFQELELVITTPASGGGVAPTFWYSTAGTGQFTQFTPVDGTNGLRNSGVISWEADDLVGHVADDVTGTFDIKVIRTRNTLSTSPVLGYAKIASVVEYVWDKEGNVNINSLATGVDGVDYNPGSDINTDIVTVGVTGAPRIYWDEAADEFVSTHIINDGGVGGGENLATTLGFGNTTGANDILIADGQAIFTDTGLGNTMLLQAYDVDGTSYTTFATLTANNTPTMDLAAAVTIGGNAIAFGGGAFHDGFSDYVAGEHLLVGAIDHDLLLNFTTTEHFLQSAITIVGTVVTGDVTAVVSAATDSLAGKVELATTAETTTGTDATRAVTPDGLHDMTSLVGAAWFLDDDAFTADSATQVASQQSIKAYIASVGGGGETLAQTLALGTTTGANNIDISDSQELNYLVTGDADTNIFNIGVTGTPTLSWDESEDIFDLNKGINISSGILFIGDTINTGMTVGLTINQGTSDDEIISFKSGDVAHPFTNQTETDTFGFIEKSFGAAGGLNIAGFRDADGSGAFALNIEGFLGEAVTTTKSSTGDGVFNFTAHITDGGTGSQAVGADGNILAISNAGTTIFILDAEGTIHQIPGSDIDIDLLTVQVTGTPTIGWDESADAFELSTGHGIRIPKRVSSEASSATPTINTDHIDIHRITALAAAITNMTTNLSGTPEVWDMIAIEITDNGTARAITWGASFANGTIALPTTTSISTTLYCLFYWDGTDWRCMAADEEV